MDVRNACPARVLRCVALVLYIFSLRTDGRTNRANRTGSPEPACLPTSAYENEVQPTNDVPRAVGVCARIGGRIEEFVVVGGAAGGCCLYGVLKYCT